MRITSSIKLLRACGGDAELRAFLILADTTGARKSSSMAKPHIYIPRTKNRRPKRLPLAAIAVAALRQLPSQGCETCLFPPDRGNVRFSGKSEHRWDIRDRFKAACARAGKQFENFAHP